MHYFLLFLKKTFRYLLKPLSFLPALCMMYLIFSFSAQDGVSSSQLSLKVSRRVVSTADRLFDRAWSQEEQKQKVEQIHFLVRKAGHVTEYFALAVCVSFPLYVYGVRGLLLLVTAGLFCTGFAGLDEFHQSFVAGRGPSARDVLIDCIGIYPGIIIVRILGFLGRKTIFAPLSLHRSKKAKHK